MEMQNERSVASLFTSEVIKDIRTTDTSHGEADYREAMIVQLDSGEKMVIKVAANAFTTAEHIRMWQRCADEYRRLGYYCPRIFAALDGIFPRFLYKGRNCIAYAEEFAKFTPADQCSNVRPFRESLYRMTALIAQERFDYTSSPSGYCLFEVFPGEEMDEVTENAIAFRDYCRTLPGFFHEQAERMFRRWEENLAALRKVYFDLPFSVYQADFNDTNVLVDENGDFVGIFDFNLAGRDEILNYLFREIYHGSLDEELEEILKALRVVSEIYTFSEAEIQAAPLIYRCLKPLWYSRVETLKFFNSDCERLQACLNDMESAQTRNIDFRSAMQRRN